MATFVGTQTKCKECGKTAYPMEQIIAEGVIFHKGCFRCAHCKSTLKLNTFVSLEGVFYCKPHFEQLFQATGSFSKSFDSAIRSEREKLPPPDSITGDAVSRIQVEKKGPSPFASKFGGTQEKCAVCAATVYPLEKVAVEGCSYHKGCFRCTHGGCSLSTTNFKTHGGKLYCSHHFNQLFLKKGDFSTLQNEGETPATSAVDDSGGSASQIRPQDGKKGEAEEKEQPTAPKTPLSKAMTASAGATPGPAVAVAATPEKQVPPKKDEDDEDEEEDDEDDDS